MTTIKLQATQQEPVAVEYQSIGDKKAGQYSITLNGETHEITLHTSAPGEGWLHLRGDIVPFYVARVGEALHVWLRGEVHILQPVEATARRGSGAGASAFGGEIKSPMPGTILKIQAAEGQAVEAHQPLIIMESMKMEMTLSAPSPGTVAKVLCQEGQLVDMGALLLQLNVSSD